MKAWRVERHGGPQALKFSSLPKPPLGPMEVRVRVESVGLNHLDLWVRNGVRGHKFPLPLIPGCDVAGRIDQFGPGAKEALARDRLREGSPVILHPGISCGHCQSCLTGVDPLCPEYGLLGETRNGGLAEWIVVPAQNVILRPKTLSGVQAAALPIAYLTAWNMLVRKAEIKSGDTVLVQAGGSGVSVAAIQIAKLHGATVMTTVGSDEKAQKARELGADQVINYKKAPFRDGVKEFLAGIGRKGCDIVIDHVGKDTFLDSLKCLALGGKLILCGATSGSDVGIDLKPVFFKNLSILGSTMGSKGDFLRILDLAAQGKLVPPIDSCFKFSNVPDALERLERREAFGKVVITMD